MSERVHTPGPWSVSCIRTRESGEPVLQILAADGKACAQVFYSDKTTAEHIASHADAHLIAAAPDLLEAAMIGLGYMQVAIGAVANIAPDDPKVKSAIAQKQKVFAAIAKATGAS